VGNQFMPSTPSYTLTMDGTNKSQTFPAAQIYNSAMYLYNSGTVLVRARWGVGAQTAVSTDFAIAPGGYFVVSKGNADTIAAIGATGGVLEITPGEGE
jgi:hypothetical protein